MSGRQVIERVWQAPIALIWELWTTPEGRSSWWGPPGFSAEVHQLDLRVGGVFEYTMRAASPEARAAMEARGRPASWSVTATITDVEPPHKLAYDSPMGPETLSTSVEFSEVAEGVRMVLVIEATRPEMVGGAAQGWRGSLERFAIRLGEA